MVTMAPMSSEISFVGNLLYKKEIGEWTLGEGLVATLKLLAGELDAASVLKHSKRLKSECTGILAMANECLEDGPEEGEKSEITRLLDLLVISNEQLEAMAGIPATTSGQSMLNATSDIYLVCTKIYPGKYPPLQEWVFV